MENHLLASEWPRASPWSDLIEVAFDRLQLLNDVIYFIRQRWRRAFEQRTTRTRIVYFISGAIRISDICVSMNKKREHVECADCGTVAHCVRVRMELKSM